jgi:hypothetical protein
MAHSNYSCIQNSARQPVRFRTFGKTSTPARGLIHRGFNSATGLVSHLIEKGTKKRTSFAPAFTITPALANSLMRIEGVRQVLEFDHGFATVKVGGYLRCFQKLFRIK